MESVKISKTQFIKFLFPSLLGIIIFLVPVHTSNGMSLIINLIIDKTKQIMGGALVPFVVAVLTFSAVCSLIGYLKKDIFKGYMGRLFTVNLFDCLIRILSAVISYSIVFKAGPEFIWSDDTGTMMMYSVVANLIPFFLWAGLFLPFLTEFGLMEFIGNLMRPIMRPIFKIPGRAAVNCAVAWVGSGTMGIVLTNKQYEDGYYTTREAISISTGFSIASIAIVSLLCSILDMTPYFPLIYICCVVIGLLMNVIMIRIPPISRKSNEYLPSALRQDISEKTPEKRSNIGYALESAMKRAGAPKGNLLLSGLKVTGDVWFTLEPVVLAVGTVATIIISYTPIVKYLAIPLMWIINALGIPEAAAASQSMLLGFVDVFLPFITGGSITSLMTKFVLSVVCCLQIIYITETGPLLLKLKMNLKFWDILCIFFLRTIIALLLVTPIAYIIF